MKLLNDGDGHIGGAQHVQIIPLKVKHEATGQPAVGERQDDEDDEDGEDEHDDDGDRRERQQTHGGEHENKPPNQQQGR